VPMEPRYPNEKRTEASFSRKSAATARSPD